MAAHPTRLGRAGRSTPRVPSAAPPGVTYLLVSSVGLVLGGGGITGAAYQFGTLIALETATGWSPNRAEVIIGTSCGALAAAMVRGNQATLETLVGDARTDEDAAAFLREKVYRRTRPRGVVRWLRQGVLPGLRHPDLRLVLGSPALYSTVGLSEWLEERLGDLAESWPDRPTVIVAYDLAERRRVPFGTEAAPPVSLKRAVAASTAVPFLFQPVKVRDRWYVDGGIASGTSADLVLANPTPLDLVIVIAPMAAPETRPHARFFEGMLDRAGRTALEAEVALVEEMWPETDILILRPDQRVMEEARRNPMSAEAAVPAFLRTLGSLRAELGHQETWAILQRHLMDETHASRVRD
jgi:NTE family protein